MIVRFNASLSSGEARISPASVREMDELDPLLAADIAKDILWFAQQLYDQQLDRFRDRGAAR